MIPYYPLLQNAHTSHRSYLVLVFQISLRVFEKLSLLRQIRMSKEKKGPDVPINRYLILFALLNSV